MTVKQTAAVSLSLVFLALAAVHVYWALGGRSGRLAALPSVDGRPMFSPSPLATLLVALALIAAAAVIAGAIGWIRAPVSTGTFRVLTFAISLVFVLRSIGDFQYVGFFKAVVDSRFAYWDSRIYSPLCLGIGVAAFLVARRKP